MSDYPTSINLCDGKYTIIYDFATGQSECLRYGQPWRQLVGDKMVLACFDEIVRLRAENAELAAAQEKVKELESMSTVKGAMGLLADQLKQLAAAQATIAKMREALFTCTPEGFCDFDSVREALSAPTSNLDALHEARALECERLADVAGDEPEHVKAMFSEWLREEAAAHRAKKGKGK